MTIDELIAAHPKLYHMAEANSWPGIQKHGLLSTSALLDLFEIQGNQRIKCESEWRQNSLHIEHPKHGKAIIRDQKPMSPSDLHDKLINITASQWYEFINRKTFFWVDENRLLRLLKAKEYCSRSHCIITVNTHSLVQIHFDEITLSDINSGFAYYGGKRGYETFKSIADFPKGKWVWELAVNYRVPDILDHTISVDEWRQDTKIRTIWTP